MKVRMLTQVSGMHDGADWPAAGEVVDLPDTEAESMIAGGVAEKVGAKAAAEPKSEPKASTKDTK